MTCPHRTMTTNATGITPPTRDTAAKREWFPPGKSAEDSGDAVSASLNDGYWRYDDCLVAPVSAADAISTTTAASDKRRPAVNSHGQLTLSPLSN